MTDKKQPRIGWAGGIRVGIEEMAKDQKSRDELEELLVLIDAIEAEENPPDRGPATADEPKRAA